MRRIERFFIAFCIIGTLARLVVKPYDPLLQVIGFCGLAVWYAAAFFFLLAGVSGKTWKPARIRWPEVSAGILAGFIAAYAVLSVLQHWLGWTHWADLLVLAGGALLVMSSVAVVLRKRRSAKSFYNRLLLRMFILFASLLLAVLLRPWLFPGRVLNYLNPV